MVLVEHKNSFTIHTSKGKWSLWNRDWNRRIICIVYQVNREVYIPIRDVELLSKLIPEYYKIKLPKKKDQIEVWNIKVFLVLKF